MWLHLSNADSLIIAVIIAMITPTNGMAAMTTLTNGNAAVIIDNWRRDHEFVIIASSIVLTLSAAAGAVGAAGAVFSDTALVVILDICMPTEFWAPYP